jgi:hypothetical protein
MVSRLEPDKYTALRLAVRRGHSKAAIAVANKLARQICAVWHYERACDTAPHRAAA